MIALILIGLLLWIGAGLSVLTHLVYRNGIQINGPMQSLAVILFWPIYLLFTP